jgi:hypothetical protein
MGELESKINCKFFPTCHLVYNLRPTSSLCFPTIFVIIKLRKTQNKSNPYYMQCANFNRNKMPNFDIGDFCKKSRNRSIFCFSLPTFWRIWFLYICFRKCSITPFFKCKGMSSNISFERPLPREYNALFVS